MSLVNMGDLISKNPLIFQVLVPFQTIYITALGAIIAALTTILAKSDYNLTFLTQPNPLPLSNELQTRTYDFIVVGAGSAGSVIANRLSENGQFTVLLLEAGGKPLLTNYVPILTTYNINLPETDWLYATVPQRYSAFANPNNVLPIARGKSLGGSSNLNYMNYVRGNPNDFDNWSFLLDDPQWNYENVLPYFKKSEDYRGNFPDPFSEYHGIGGPLRVSSQKQYQPLINEWLDAAREFGFNTTDQNARQTSTFFPLDVTIKDGQRHGTYDAFLKPILNRSNLKIISYALVTKINLDLENRATGVTYKRKGQTFTADAAKEVVLCAGSFGTSRLLMLSGIGNSHHLKSVGISPIVDLPGVGENLIDHVTTFVGPFLLNDTVSLNQDKNGTIGATLQYLLKRSGLFAFNAISSGGFFSTAEPTDPSWPNVAAFQTPLGIHNAFSTFYESLSGIKKGLTKSYFEEYIGRDATLGMIYLARPASRGTLRLASSDPEDKPLIDPNYYSDEEGIDMQHMIRGFKVLVSLYEETKSWQKYNAQLLPKPFPGCENFVFRSDEYYECHIRHVTATFWHPCCTAKMGHLQDPLAVVDSNLRVINVRGLRVADASVMPVIPNGNLNAPVIMIGEKAADIIINDWR